MKRMLFGKVVMAMLGVLAAMAFAGDTVLAGSAGPDVDESASLQLTSAELPTLVAGTLAASDLRRLIVAGPLSDAGTNIADPFGGPRDSEGIARSSRKRPGDLRKLRANFNAPPLRFGLSHLGGPIRVTRGDICQIDEADRKVTVADAYRRLISPCSGLHCLA